MSYPSNNIDTESVAQDQLRSFHSRWERLETEKTAISDDLKELFAEAKANGFDTKVLRSVFRDSTKDVAERMEREALYDLYAAALSDLPRDARDPRVEIIEQFGDDTAADEAGDLAPHESTAAGMDRHVPVRMTTGGAPQPEQQDRIGGSGNDPQADSSPAGTQAPPVDTLNRAGQAARWLRPYCLHADDLPKCGGMGKQHCQPCLKAHADAEGFSA